MLTSHYTRVTQGFPSTQNKAPAPDWVLATTAIYFLPLLSRIVRLSSVLCRQEIVSSSHQGRWVI